MEHSKEKLDMIDLLTADGYDAALVNVEKAEPVFIKRTDCKISRTNEFVIMEAKSVRDPLIEKGTASVKHYIPLQDVVSISFYTSNKMIKAGGIIQP